MKHLLRRLTALLMVMAMVMSFAVTAAAAEESSTEVSAAAAEQETDPVIEAEDLLEADTSDADKSTDADKSGDTDKSTDGDKSGDTDKGTDGNKNGDASTSTDTETPENDPDESAQAEEAEAAATETQSEEADPEASVEEEVQEAEEAEALTVQAADGMGWNKSGDDFTLSYSDNGTQTAAVNGAFAVPAEENVNLGGTNYTFAAGVYQFDENGKLVLDTALAADADVTVLRKDAAAEKLTLNKKDTAKRDMTFTAGAAVNGANVTPAATLTNGDKDGVFYYEGVKFNGLYRESADAKLQGVKDGVKSDFGGQMAQKEGRQDYLIGTELQTADKFDNLWYYQGVPYTGFFKADDANNPNLTYYIKDGKGALLRGKMSKADTIYIENYVEKPLTDLWYADGELFTGWYAATGKSGIQRVYLLKNGENVAHAGHPEVFDYTGLMEAFTDDDGTVINAYAVEGRKQAALTGLYYQRGVALTGVPSVRTNRDNKFPADLYLYKNGKRQKVKDGWYTAPRAKEDFWKPYVYYYFKGNKALVGENKKLTAIKGSKNILSGASTQKGYKDTHSYYYTFRENGTLVTNLFKYKPGILKSGKFRIHADHTTYTGTILMRNSKTGKYDIPVKSFVVAMSLSKSATASTGTKYGNYPLASGHSTWYHYQSPRTGSWCWYSSSVHIWGSGSMFHSANYKNFSKSASEKTRRHKLTAHIYNQIGHAVTQHCVRAQTINIRLITAMYKSSSKFRNHGRSCTKNIRVYLSRSTTNNFLPFGQMTLTNNFDVNGYILQNADGYGYGKDCAFDPTDHKCVGETIYICTKKTSKKADCTKIKMTGYSYYELYYAAV